MSSPDFSMHRHTPVISVQDPRALTVRVVQFCRRAVEETARVRVTQQLFDAMGRPVASRDPRLFALSEADADVPTNLIQTFSLGGALLLSDSVDAGWRLGLSGEAGQALERWDGRETHSVMRYDELLRPLGISEQDQVIERFTYAPADAQAAAHNLCGQLARHDDPAGSEFFEEYSIGGALLQTQRCFLQAIERPDWPVSEAARDALLETMPGAVTRYAVNPWAEAIGQTDAQGNRQRLEMTCAGALRSTYVQLAGQAEQLLVSDIRYNAFGQVEAETAGNGVQTRTVYDPVTGLLQRLTTSKDDGATLQDLNYEHDPLGNILRIEDAAQPIRYFRNQAVADISTYRYDTLYQLIEATGREALAIVTGPQLPLFQSPADPHQLVNYRQGYDYDAGGNLLSLSHVGGQPYTQRMIIARYSNRSLPVVDEHIPDEQELADGFDANGNLLALQRGQALAWDVRNQLQQVTPVQREEAEDDHERYSYDGHGQRLRKVRITQAANTTHRAEVRYLPGLEIRTDSATGETLHVINAPAGRSDVRVLHWTEDTNPEGIANDQVRYNLSDHLGSSTLELDAGAHVISQERYYPFGGTSWWAGRSAVEAKYKTVRYSGKERDATGLYYYGLRYYAPWLCRWVNPDPAGLASGMNLYQMVDNNPVCKVDDQGLEPVPYGGVGDQYEESLERHNDKIQARGRDEIAGLTPLNPQKLAQALKISQISIDVTHSQLKLSNLSQNVKDMIVATMGIDSLNYIPAIEYRFKLLSRDVQHYIGGERYNQFAFVENTLWKGLSWFEDPHKRIFLSSEHLSTHTLDTGHTVTHEQVHFSPGRAEDYAYVVRTPMGDPNIISQHDYDEHIRSSLERARQFSAGEQNVVLFKNFEKAAKRPHMDLGMRMRLFDVKSEQDLKVERLSSPVVRGKLFRANADSVTLFAEVTAQEPIATQLLLWGQYHGGKRRL